jgi:hypothetical protein
VDSGNIALGGIIPASFILLEESSEPALRNTPKFICESEPFSPRSHFPFAESFASHGAALEW